MADPQTDELNQDEQMQADNQELQQDTEV